MTSRETAGVARRSAGLVVFAVVVAAGVALVLSLLSTPRYRATADVLAGAGADGVELVVASGSELVAQARAVVGDGPELSVEAVGDVLQFTATSTNADNAATAANAYADVYVGAGTRRGNRRPGGCAVGSLRARRGPDGAAGGARRLGDRRRGRLRGGAA
jgi:hypothetical protein